MSLSLWYFVMVALANLVIEDTNIFHIFNSSIDFGFFEAGVLILIIWNIHHFYILSYS